MPRPPAKYPTELELAILKILWQHGPANVRQVRDVLADQRDLAYTSVMTVMGIMTDKGHVSRKKTKGTYVYRAVLRQKTTEKSMVSDLVDRVFDGSAAAAAVHLLESSDIDTEELAALRRLLEQKEGEQS
jgi:predicted transcriptional regulator